LNVAEGAELFLGFVEVVEAGVLFSEGGGDSVRYFGVLGYVVA